MKLLLEREEANPNKPDGGGKTPLMWVGWRRAEKIKVLLQLHKAVASDGHDHDLIEGTL